LLGHLEIPLGWSPFRCCDADEKCSLLFGCEGGDRKETRCGEKFRPDRRWLPFWKIGCRWWSCCACCIGRSWCCWCCDVGTVGPHEVSWDMVISKSTRGGSHRAWALFQPTIPEASSCASRPASSRAKASSTLGARELFWELFWDWAWSWSTQMFVEHALLFESFWLYSLMAQDDSTCKNVLWKCDRLSVDSLTNCKSSSLIVKDFWIIVKDFSDVNPIALWLLWSQQFILIYLFQVFPIECPRCQIERFKYKLRA